MSTGRTLNRWAKIYGNGYDLTGYARSIGTLPMSFETPDISTIGDGARGVLVGAPEGREVAINCIMDTDLQTAASTPSTYWDLMIQIGMRAAPVMGDPVYMGKFLQTQFKAAEDGGAIVTDMSFTWGDGGDIQVYRNPWGYVVAPWADYTGANTAVGYDDLGAVGPTAYGGYFMYQIFAYTTNGTVTISLDDSATNLNDAAFAPLAGATTAAIAQTSIPCAGIIELPRTTSVRRYIRHQIALAGMTHVWMSVAWCRGTVGLT